MNFKSKFDIGQEAFFMNRNVVTSSKIGDITMKASLRFSGNIEIVFKYTLIGWGSQEFEEKTLFISKKDLLKSL